MHRAWLIKHSKASGDAALFKGSILARLQDLKEWVDDPTGKQAKFFGHMTVSQFKVWHEKSLSKSKKGKKRDADRASTSASSGKRYIEVPSDDERLNKKHRGHSNGSRHRSSPPMSEQIDDSDVNFSDYD